MSLLLELVYFLGAFKNKDRAEAAISKAQEEERQRISADIHDELGSGLTVIRLMSEIARAKMKDPIPELERISSSADDLLNKMNAIIWSMNSGNDSVDNLVAYTRSWSMEYFENTAINCKVVSPSFIPGREITGEKRRNIFLCVKEALNNILKHAQADRVLISIHCEPQFQIEISDNGRGIDLDHLRSSGNGLRNIKRRMENIGGCFRIRNRNGTILVLALPY